MRMSKTFEPETSIGRRSGVNWMRLNVQSTLAAKAFASIVLPTPGTSRKSTCPCAATAQRRRAMTSSLPMMILRMFAATFWNCSGICGSIAIGALCMAADEVMCGFTGLVIGVSLSDFLERGRGTRGARGTRAEA